MTNSPRRISVFDMFKIGIGPSSSHTLGPWRAVLDFFSRDAIVRVMHDIVRVDVCLMGSLGLTGKGHQTDKAIVLALLGHDPITLDDTIIESTCQDIRDSEIITLRNGHSIDFIWDEHITYDLESPLDVHPNTMVIQITIKNNQRIHETYYSVGGGAIESASHGATGAQKKEPPYASQTAAELVSHCKTKGLSIADLVQANEILWLNSSDKLNQQLDDIWHVMLSSISRGCQTAGELPGGLHVKRRAQEQMNKLTKGAKWESGEALIQVLRGINHDFETVNALVSCFALAVNEVNAALGRVVTSPTNGSSGVIPAVLMYAQCCTDYKTRNDMHRFLLTAGEIGTLFVKKATISAAAGGCQAEIGVSSAMAAAGLTELRGGSPEQVVMAAEIAMEHHLGLTCDPIAGLVQIPCIERNAIGAMKAITASQLAMDSDPQHAKVSLDDVIATMWETAQDMHYKYKETAQGGLATQVPLSEKNC